MSPQLPPRRPPAKRNPAGGRDDPMTTYQRTNSMKTITKLPILIFSVLSTTLFAQNTNNLSQDYFFGKWEIRTYGYKFDSDGTVVIFNPDDGATLSEGKWGFNGKLLTLDTETGKQVVKVNILSKDSWEWISSKDRVWEATRLK
jgi:hypothetical protein